MSDARLSDILRAIGGDDDQRIENLTQRMEAIRREVLDEMANVMAAHHTVSHPRTFEDRIEIERAAYERGRRYGLEQAAAKLWDAADRCLCVELSNEDRGYGTWPIFKKNPACPVHGLRGPEGGKP